jgi:hypothetical protein
VLDTCSELGTDMFIVQKGRVEVVRTATEQPTTEDKDKKKDKDKKNVSLFSITIGTYFGENAVVHQEVRCACRPPPERRAVKRRAVSVGSRSPTQAFSVGGVRAAGRCMRHACRRAPCSLRHVARRVRAEAWGEREECGQRGAVDAQGARLAGALQHVSQRE